MSKILFTHSYFYRFDPKQWRNYQPYPPYGTIYAAALMRAQGHGRIVNCSSVLGLVGMRWRAAYVSTKFALEGLTDVLRVEMRGTGIHVDSHIGEMLVCAHIHMLHRLSRSELSYRS